MQTLKMREKYKISVENKASYFFAYEVKACNHHTLNNIKLKCPSLLSCIQAS